LYFNQLNALGGTLIQNQNTMQAEIEALQAADAAMQLQIDRDLTLVWLGSGEGLFSG
jgi:hypothetical protein